MSGKDEPRPAPYRSAKMHMKTAFAINLKTILLAGIVACLVFASPALALDAGAGAYQYKDTETGKTLNVWYYKPADFDPKTPVLIVMHGMSRNAESYRNSWVEHARREKIMVLTPQFSKEDFPEEKAYNQGSYLLPDNQINPKEKWSFMIVERVFDDFIQSREKTEARQYYLYGHSAGSQFVHRFMLLVPEARVKLAVCANAGFYTVPDFNEKWPWGIKGTDLKQDSVRRYVSLPMVIMLGDKDIDPKGAMFPRGKTVDRQGITRLARGMYFFNFGQAAAERLDVPFGWKLQIVPDAPHGGPLLSAAAAKIFASDMARKDTRN